MAIDEVKKEQRRRCSAIRKELGEERRAASVAAVTEWPLSLPEWADADAILEYLDFEPEIAARDAIRAAWEQGKTVALPWRVPGFVSGLTFDSRGFRMGYKGGFCDTFLAKFDGVSLDLCREPQMPDDLHALGVIEAHDRAVQMVVTDERVILQ